MARLNFAIPGALRHFARAVTGGMGAMSKKILRDVVPQPASLNFKKVRAPNSHRNTIFVTLPDAGGGVNRGFRP